MESITAESGLLISCPTPATQRAERRQLLGVGERRMQSRHLAALARQELHAIHERRERLCVRTFEHPPRRRRRRRARRA